MPLTAESVDTSRCRPPRSGVACAFLRGAEEKFRGGAAASEAVVTTRHQVQTLLPRKGLAGMPRSMRGMSVTGAIVVAGIACGASALAKGGPASHPFAFLAPAVRLEGLAPSTLLEGQVSSKCFPGAATSWLSSPQRGRQRRQHD